MDNEKEPTVPVWKIKANELLAKHIEHFATLHAELDASFDAADELIDETYVYKNQMEMFINGLLNGDFTYDATEHALMLNEETNSLYLHEHNVMEITQELEEDIELEELNDEEVLDLMPEPLKVIPLTQKQKQRFLDTIRNYIITSNEFQQIKYQTMMIQDEFNEQKEEIIRIISDPAIARNFYSEDNEEFFDKEKHLLLINFNKGDWGLEYIRSEDLEEFQTTHPIHNIEDLLEKSGQ